MKRSAQHVLDCAVAKRQCWQQQTEEPASSSAAPLPQHHAMQPKGMPFAQAHCGINKQLASAAVEHVLEQTLTEADTALHLTLHAMSLATQIYECGSPDAADRALCIAEQALAATVQQLARAQALVTHKVRVQAGGGTAAVEEDDAELQDTCSSNYSCCSSQATY